MSNGNDGNRTVFRPSPLQGLNQGQGAAAPPPAGGNQWAPPPGPASGGGGWSPPPQAAQHFAPPPSPSYGNAQFDAPPPPVGGAPQGSAQLQSRMREDDVPLPASPPNVRNPMMLDAAPVLALAASVRSGRARVSLPQLHREASRLIAHFDRSIAGRYPEEVRQRAKYGLCATLDDIAQNLPGTGVDGAEWARRSMVVTFFQENIGGDRFWQLVDDMIRNPAQNADIIELYHACLAAGFEGRFRVMPDGKRRLHEIMTKLYAALEFPRALTNAQLVTQWPGEKAPLGKVGLWGYVLLAGAVALGALFLIYVILRLLLMSSGSPAWDNVSKLSPDTPLRLSRAAAPPPTPPATPQVEGLKQFLKPEIDQGLVVVEQDASTVRVRTTVGQLFKSASDQLEPSRQALFERIGKAVEGEAGDVKIEGHSDSDRIASLQFPDNMALSKARAETVATIIKAQLSNAGRVSTEGFGDTRPVASNDTPDGKSQNRRVEIVVPRRS